MLSLHVVPDERGSWRVIDEATATVLSEQASTTAAEIAAQSLAKAASADAILVHDRYNRVGPAVGYRLSHSRSRQDAAT
jgi:hypothetical protein